MGKATVTFQQAFILAGLLAVTAACPGPARDTQQPAPPQTQLIDAAPPAIDSQPASGESEAAIEALADELLRRAAAHEPEVSAMLLGVADKAGTRMAGFEHRLKTRSSTLRKIRSKLLEEPGLEVSEVVIDDALRYTMLIADKPPGHHAKVIRGTFATLESSGHRVDEVKNYWPRGDNYSGVNSVLIAPDGLRWELQFHTPESFATKERDHALYEEMRADETSPERKRELFEELARPWQTVAIPKGLLKKGALHPVDEVIERPAPPLP